MEHSSHRNSTQFGIRRDLISNLDQERPLKLESNKTGRVEIFGVEERIRDGSETDLAQPLTVER
jgi:hypothetical protein